MQQVMDRDVWIKLSGSDSEPPSFCIAEAHASASSLLYVSSGLTIEHIVS